MRNCIEGHGLPVCPVGSLGQRALCLGRRALAISMQSRALTGENGCREAPVPQHICHSPYDTTRVKTTGLMNYKCPWV